MAQCSPLYLDSTDSLWSRRQRHRALKMASVPVETLVFNLAILDSLGVRDLTVWNHVGALTKPQLCVFIQHL